jgi:ligand-binding sensor domain-containing protein
MRRLLILVLLATCAGPRSVAGSDSHPGDDSGWTTYTSASGLAVDAVGALAAAPNGDLWCAYLVAGAGLSRFDGETWIHHDSEDGLPDGTILWTGPLAVAPDGTVWVGMFDRGVSKYDGTGWTTYTTGDGLLRDAVSTLTVSPDGIMWCGHAVENGGISRFDGETWTTYGPAETGGPGENPILSIAAGPDGMLWIGADGVTGFDGEDWLGVDPGEGASIPIALALAVAEDGTLWVGGNGVSCRDEEGWHHFDFVAMGVPAPGEHGVTSLALEPDGDLWAGAGDLGVFHFDGETWTRFTSADGLVHDSVMAVAVTPDGALWCGTQAGISRYLPGAGSLQE